MFRGVLRSNVADSLSFGKLVFQNGLGAERFARDQCAVEASNHHRSMHRPHTLDVGYCRPPHLPSCPGQPNQG